MVFEKLKPVLEQRRVSSKQKLTDFDFFMLGLISKFIASTVTYPYILIKSRVYFLLFFFFFFFYLFIF